MTTIERRGRLIEWLDIIYADVQQLLIDDHLFWEFQKLVEENAQFRQASGLFLQFIGDGYIRSATVGVRRHAKSGRDSVSPLRFLDEVKNYPALVSREHYIALYAGKEDWQIEMGQHDFDKVAGVGSQAVPAKLATQQIDDLRIASENIEHYADRRIAHYDRRDLAKPIPRFSELTDALKVLERFVILYWRLLKGPSMRTILPTILYDWRDIFQFAWRSPSGLK